MIVERTQLEGKKMVELKNMVAAMGGEPSPSSETKESLVNRILLEAAKQPDTDIDNTHKAEKKADEIVNGKTGIEPPPEQTIEQVLKAVNSFILRGMKVYHNPHDKTWRFRVEIKSGRVRDTNTGEILVVRRFRDDSGTMRQPIEVIKRCASILMTNVVTQKAIEKEFDPSADGYIAVA